MNSYVCSGLVRVWSVYLDSETKTFFYTYFLQPVFCQYNVKQISFHPRHVFRSIFFPSFSSSSLPCIEKESMP